MKIGLLISIIFLMILSGCNNPDGGSVVSEAHTPLLKAPANFTFTSIQAANGTVTFRWQPSSRASDYKIYMGLSSSAVTTPVDPANCTVSQRTCTISGLDPSLLYYFSVDAINVAGKTTVTTVGTALSVGTFDLTSSSVGDGQMTIAWGNSSSATSYNVLYGTTSGSYTVTRTNVTSPYTITGLNNGVTYYVRVLAVNNNNGYLLSDTETHGQPFGAPSQPTGLALNALPGQIDLSWDDVPGATSYKVFRGASSSSLSQIASGLTASHYSDTTTVDGSTYYYYVKANNGYDSAASAIASASSISNFNLTSVVVGPASQQLTVTWPSTTGATSYNINYGTNPANLSSTLTNVTSPYILTGLTGGSAYYVEVVAKNAIGLGTSLISTNQLHATPISSIAAPSGLTASATPGQISLHWNAVSGASSYEIYRGTTTGVYSSLQSGVLGNSFIDSTVSDGTTYFYVVRSFNGLSSVNSSEVSAKSIENFSIASTSVLSPTSIQVSWPTVNGAATYDIVYGTATGVYTGSVTGVTSPYSITGLVANTTYHIAVRARNAVGAGTMVASAEVDQKTSTAAPTGLAASATPGQVSLTWGAVAGATSYSLYRGNAPAALSIHASGLTTANYTDSSIAVGTIYYYSVVANNGADSAQSAVVSVRPIANFTFLSATIASATSATLNWTNPAGATAYDVRYGTIANGYNLTASNVTAPYTLTGLTAGATYNFIIRAKNTTGSGTTLDSSSRSLQLSAAAPTGVVASVSTGKIDLSWSAVSSATSYNIYRGTASGSLSQLTSNVTGTTYSDTSVSDGTQYYYTIRAFNGAESVDSSQVTGMTIASFSASSIAVISPTSLTITWPTPAGAATFDVLYRTSPSGTYTTLANKTSPLTMTGLTANTTYYVAVKAKNAIGPSTSVQTADLSQITPVAGPSGLAAVQSNGTVTLGWTSVTGATSYKINRGISSGGETSLATGVTTNSYTDTTVAPGTTYFYNISAYNGADSPLSSEVSVKPISTFSIMSATVVSSTAIDVSWPTVAGADSYDLKYGTNPASLTTLTNQSSPKSLTGLSSNTTYYFVVVAKNAVGSGSTQSSAQVTATTAFGAPSGLVATASPGQVGLNWSSVSGATTYKIYRGTSSGALSLLNTSVTNAFMDTTVSDGTTYFYTVRAYNGTDSADSTEVSIQSIGSFSLTAATSASASTINLTWSSATGAATYDVRYGTSPGVYLFTASNVTSPYTLSGLTSGTTYYVSIQAKNTVGPGTTLNSNERNAKTGLGAPTTLNLVATSGNVAVSWGAVSGATNYNVYRGTSSGTYSQIASAVTGTSYSDSSVSNGTTYYYVVRSFNGIESVDSVEKSIQPIGTFAIIAATTASSAGINVSWPATTGASTYDVRYGTASGSYTTTVTGVTSPYSITGLTPATQYYIVVRANNSVGVSTSLSTAESLAKTATAAPTSLAATTASGQVNLTWAAVTGAASYNVYRGTTTGVYTLLTSGVLPTSFSDSSVVNGTQHFYVVRAFNGTESANSNEATAQSLGSFSISSITGPSSSSLQVTWSSSTGATGYDLYYGTATGVYVAPVVGVTSPYTISGLSPNTRYYIKIKARNAIGAGSSVFTAESSQITPVAAPTSLVATASTSEIQLTWVAASGATSYKIYRGTISGSLSEIATGVTTQPYVDTGLTNGTTYYYAIKSFNGSDSAFSLEVFKQPIATPTISSITGNTSSSFLVSWSATTGATSYDLKYSTTSGSGYTTLTGVTSPYSITGLNAGEVNYVVLVAKNTVGGGTSVSSAESSGEPNTPPDLSPIVPQSMISDTSHNVDFTLADDNNVLTCAGSMSATSTNTTLLANTGIVFSGTIPNCTATITPKPAQTGTTTITFTATDGISPVSTSFGLTVNGCAVASMVWVTSPVGMTAGNLFGTAPAVKLLKADGSICTTNSTPVTIDVYDDTSVQQDATITAGSSVVPAAGIATFSAAKMTRAGANMTLMAYTGTIASPVSSTFTVTAGAASKLSWQVPPITSPVNGTIPTSTIVVADAYDNAVTTTNATISISLLNSSTLAGATGLSGTLSGTTTAGYLNFSNLKVSARGSYVLKATATGYPNINSPAFSIINIVNQTVTSTLEMLQGPVTGVATASSTTAYNRSLIMAGSGDNNGTITLSWSILATNSATAAGTYKAMLYRGTTSSTVRSTATIPANLNTPTWINGSSITTALSATNTTWKIAVQGTGVKVYKSLFKIRQVTAGKTQVYIPMSQLESTNTNGVTTASTTYTVPNNNNFYSTYWDSTKIGRVDNILLWFSSTPTTGGQACAALFNKTTNTQIGGDFCNSSATAENVPSTFTINPSLMPSAAEIEIRYKTTLASAPATIFKAGLLVKLVNITNMQAIQIAASPSATLNANKDFLESRLISHTTEYGTGLVSQYLSCYGKAISSGSGTFVLKDNSTNTSGTTSASNISSSTISFSNQSSVTRLEAGPLATTNGNYMFVNYTHGSGSFVNPGCLFRTEAAY